MSSTTPFGSSGEPEYLASHAPQPQRPGRRKAMVLGAVGVVVAGTVGAGAWAVTQLMGGGPGAASVLPDSALLYAAVDLDPSAGQKIEALKTLKKFPAIDAELDLGSRDDVRRWVADKVVEDGDCKGLDYADDVEPWIGDKMGLAALPGDKDYPDAVIALQVTDEAKAEDGIARIFEACDPQEKFGVAFLDGYALLAETDEIAEAAKTAAEKAPLADDADYTRAIESVGTQGIVSVYVSPEGPAALSEALMGQMMGATETPPFCLEAPEGLSEQELADLEQMCDQFTPSADAEERLDSALKDFGGAAATLRFENGGIELAAAGAGLPAWGAEPTSVSDLPATTVAALGFSLPEGWTDTLTAQLETSFGPMLQQMLQQAEVETGLQLPEDLEKAFGTESVVALDGSTDFDALASSNDPTAVKAGIRVASDEADVRRIITALLAAGGAADSDLIKVRADGGRVAVGFDDDYVSELLAGGELGSSQTFQDAVAEAEKARLALFIDFDAADDWLERFVDAVSGGDEEAVANARPLEAFGLSGWVDGDTSHFVVRLSTD